MSVDIGDSGPGIPCLPVYAAGYNPSPIAAYVWARQAQRCIAYLAATSDNSPPSFFGNVSDPMVRLVHLDFMIANPRILGSSWKLLQAIDPYNGFAIYLSVTSAVTNELDECGNRATGPHLHMDGPETEQNSRNLSLSSEDPSIRARTCLRPRQEGTQNDSSINSTQGSILG